MIGSWKEAEAACGPLSHTFKMPCPSYNLPAEMCRLGSRLRNVEGSVCSRCYARRNRYSYPSVRNALWRHYASLDHPEWAEALAFLVKREGNPHFRFHDSGDLADPEHLSMVVDVVRRCPDVMFWLPTLEVKMIKDFFRPGNQRVPPNMTVRISSAMVGEGPYRHVLRMMKSVPGVVASMVSLDPPADVFKCPATWTDVHVCGDCRSCWDRTVDLICYKAH